MKKSRLNVLLLAVILIGLIILVSRGNKTELEVVPDVESNEIDVSMLSPEYRRLVDFEYAYNYYLRDRGYGRFFWWNGNTYFLKESDKEIIPENYLVN